MNKDMDAKLGLFLAFVVIGFVYFYIPIKAMKQIDKEIKKSDQAVAKEREIKYAYDVYCDSMSDVNFDIEQTFLLSRITHIEKYIDYNADKSAYFAGKGSDCCDSVKKYKLLRDSVSILGTNLDTNKISERIKYFSAEADKYFKKVDDLDYQFKNFLDSIYNTEPDYKPVMSFAQFKECRNKKQNIVCIRNKCNGK